MEGPDQEGVMFAAQARTFDAQGLLIPLGRGLMRTGTPCKVWPLEEDQETGARTAAGRAREVVMVTNRETCRKTVILRGADCMSERGDQETRNVYGGAGGGEQGPRRANPITRGQADNAVELEQEGGTSRTGSAKAQYCIGDCCKPCCKSKASPYKFRPLKMGGYPSKEKEIVKAENFNRESLTDHSFSVMNVNGAYGWGFSPGESRPTTSLLWVRCGSLQGSRQEDETPGNHKPGDSQAVMSGLRPGARAGTREGDIYGGALKT